MGEAVNAALLPYVKNEPAPERQRYILGLMSLPDVAGVPVPAETREEFNH